MKAKSTEEIVPLLISQILSDLAESIDCEWAICVDSNGASLAAIGRPAAPDCTAAFVSALIQEQPSILESSQATELFPQSDWTPRLLCPIAIKGCPAVIALGPKRDGGSFSESDREWAAKLTKHFCAVVSDERMALRLSQQFGEMRRAKMEREAARQVQYRSFPTQLPRVKGLDFYGECRPLEEVGGDFFDFMAPDDSSLLFSIGDVSGKGVPAAILMASLQASLRVLQQKRAAALSSVVSDLNEIVWRISPDNFFATFFYGRIDCKRRELHYVNAGHEPPLLIRRGGNRVVALDGAGTVLGFSTHSSFERRTIPFEPGDILVAATDGVTEASDADDHRKMILDFVGNDPDASSSKLARHIIGSRGVSNQLDIPPDDRTVVVVRFGQTVQAVEKFPAPGYALTRLKVQFQS